jgi:putative photosynthetic complex assembly protein
MDTRTAGKPFPKAPLIGGIGLLLVTLAVTDFGGLIFNKGAYEVHGTALLSRNITFEDRADGAVLVRNAESGALVSTLEPGSNAFARGALRALTRERKLDAIGRVTPFRLTAWDDGRLTLEDPATGHKVALEAFGDTNKGAFLQILEAAR